MPIRDYKCLQCKTKIEDLEAMNADPVKDCVCGSKMVRQVSVSNPHFKGSGFYKTDY